MKNRPFDYFLKNVFFIIVQTHRGIRFVISVDRSTASLINSSRTVNPTGFSRKNRSTKIVLDLNSKRVVDRAHVTDRGTHGIFKAVIGGGGIRRPPLGGIPRNKIDE